MDESGVRVFQDQYKWDDSKRELFINKYATLLASMLEESYQWFYLELVQDNLIKEFLVMKEDFDGTIEFMQFACLKNKLNDSLTNSLMEILRSQRDKLCHSEDSMKHDS